MIIRHTTKEVSDRLDTNGDSHPAPATNGSAIWYVNPPSAHRQSGQIRHLGKIGKNLLPVDKRGAILASIDEIPWCVRSVDACLMCLEAREGSKHAVRQPSGYATLFPPREETQVRPLTVKTVNRLVIPVAAPTPGRGGRSRPAILTFKTLPRFAALHPAATAEAWLSTPAIIRPKPLDAGHLHDQRVKAYIRFDLELPN